MMSRRIMASAGTVFQFKDGVGSSAGFIVWLVLTCVTTRTVRSIGGVRPGNHLVILLMAVGARHTRSMCAVVRRGMGVLDGRPCGGGMTGVARGTCGYKMPARFAGDVGIDAMASGAVAGDGLDVGMVASVQEFAGNRVTEIA